MKVNILDAHDRLKHFTKQSFDIAACCDDLIKQRPFGDHPFYILTHIRTDDDGVRKRYIWSPWICKPRAQTNTMLFKVYPQSPEVIKRIWILPIREMWDCFEKDKLFENEFIVKCTNTFDLDKSLLELPEPDDPTPKEQQEIVFEYQPQLFKRETLPEDKKHIWDIKMASRKKIIQSLGIIK